MKKTLSVSGVIFDSLNTILMIVVFVVMVYPFVYILNYSFSTPALIGASPLLVPAGFSLEAYRLLLSDASIYRALFISVSRSIIGPLSMIVVCSMAGYVLSKKHLVFGKFFRWTIFFTMYFSAGLIPIYLLISNLGLLNTYWVYILPMMVSAFNIVLIRTYIESLPSSVEEAALIDGANEFQAFWHVIFPVCLPVNAAVILFSAIAHWNDFISTQLFNVMSPHLYTIQYVLFNAMAIQLSTSLEEAMRLAGAGRVTAMTLNMAITVITVVPVMLVYPFLAKYFVSGLMVGSVKA